MITIIRNIEEEFNKDEMIIPKSLVESPMLKSCSKLLILYLLANEGNPYFSWSLFESRTGVKRREREKAQHELLDKGIIQIHEGEKIGFVIVHNIKLNYSTLMNYISRSLHIQKRRKMGYKNNHVQNEHDEDNATETLLNVQNEHGNNEQNVH